MTDFAQPRVLFSRCLGFEACRWDGGIVASDPTARLRDFCEVVTRCPEADIGLGTPRPPIRLVLRDDEVRLHQPKSGRDLTDAMNTYAARTLEEIGPIDGFVLKSRSPSCGVRDVKIFAGFEPSSPSSAKGAGLFARAVIERHGAGAVEDEGRLTNLAIRERFFTRVFTLADFRRTRAAGRVGELVEFHARHKLLLMAAHQTEMRRLGRVVAEAKKRPIDEVFDDYGTGLRRALDAPWRRGAVVNVLMHAMGYFRDSLSAREKTHFLRLLADYRLRRVPLSTATAVVRSWIERVDEPYLRAQRFFEPFPPSLIDPADSAGGRGD